MRAANDSSSGEYNKLITCAQHQSENFTKPTPEFAAKYNVSWDESVHGYDGPVQASYSPYDFAPAGKPDFHYPLTQFKCAPLTRIQPYRKLVECRKKPRYQSRQRCQRWRRCWSLPAPASTRRDDSHEVSRRHQPLPAGQGYPTKLPHPAGYARRQSPVQEQGSVWCRVHHACHRPGRPRPS